MTTEHKSRARSLGRADAATPEEIVHLRLASEAEPPHDRPRTRADCATVHRPCPFVGCKHNLYLDYMRNTGNILLNFPDREPDEMPADGSCSLDVAEQGGVTLQAAGQLINLTRERIRQVETAALRKIRSPPAIGRNGKAAADSVAALRVYADHETDLISSPIGEHMIETGSDATAEEEESPRHITFKLPHFLDGTVTDEEYCESLHRIWERWRSDRTALERGDLHLVAGRYVSDRHAGVLLALGEVWRTQGRAPSLLEIADLAEIKGAMASRRQAVASVLRSLRDMGLIEGKNAHARVVQKPGPQTGRTRQRGATKLPPQRAGMIP